MNDEQSWKNRCQQSPSCKAFICFWDTWKKMSLHFYCGKTNTNYRRNKFSAKSLIINTSPAICCIFSKLMGPVVWMWIRVTQRRHVTARPNQVACPQAAICRNSFRARGLGIKSKGRNGHRSIEHSTKTVWMKISATKMAATGRLGEL